MSEKMRWTAARDFIDHFIAAEALDPNSEIHAVESDPDATGGAEKANWFRVTGIGGGRKTKGGNLTGVVLHLEKMTKKQVKELLGE